MERTALSEFETKVLEKLKTAMLDDNGKEISVSDRSNLSKAVMSMYKKEVDALLKKLENRDLKSKLYAVLMAACGLIVGFLAIIPLAIPLCFSPVRNYIHSFFNTPPSQSSTLVKSAIDNEHLEQLEKILLEKLECLQHQSDMDVVVLPSLAV